MITLWKSDRAAVTVCWTNWTIGFWFDRNKLKMWGAELGPVEFVYMLKTHRSRRR